MVGITIWFILSYIAIGAIVAGIVGATSDFISLVHRKEDRAQAIIIICICWPVFVLFGATYWFTKLLVYVVDSIILVIRKLLN